jgi:hypothetical protein
MRCLKYSEVNLKRSDSYYIVGDIDLTLDWILDMIYRIGDDECDNVAEAIRSVGNNKITAIVPKLYSYKVGDELLSMSNLSNGEFVFLLGELARIYGEKMVIIVLVTQLSNRCLENFIKRYGKYDITIVVNDNKFDEYCNIYGCGVDLCVW